MLDRNMGHIFKYQNSKDEKSTLDRINERLDSEEGKISNFEDIAIKIIDKETREKILKKNREQWAVRQP